MSSDVGKPEVVAGQYRVLRSLGSGAHGTVDLAEDLLNSGRRVALKRLEGIVGAGDPEPAAEVLRWFLHPGWAEILDEGRLDAHGRFQVLRYVPGTGLDRVELPRPAEEVLRFLEDGARVLRALHRLGVIHYDVTPGNFVRDETPDGVTFTLTDGGLANLGPVRGIARGTPLFMAPEVVEGSAHDHRADLYALGLVAFRLATGGDPFRGGAGEVLGRRRREDAPLLRAVRPDLPEGLERVVAALLQRDPARRPSHAGEVLDLLTHAGRPDADRVRPEEAAAFATTGPLVGRAGIVDRFRSACRGITTAPPARTPGEEFFLTEGPTDLPDLVLVLHGPEGVGCTRVLREMSAVARTEGLATLALSGRGGAADRRSPIRRLSECLASLAPDGDPYFVAAGQHRGESGGRESVDARVMERFVELCERVAGQRPVVLIVEDFAELPDSSQEALRVLARHLQTRAEHPDGRRLPRLLLVIDHGAEDPKDLLIPDAHDPRRPCIPIGPFTEPETARFVASRLDPRREPRATEASPEEAAYRPLPSDIPALQRATEGLPRLLTAAMAEALLRGDLRSELSHWVWDTGPVPTYSLPRTLPIAALRALESAPPAVRDAAIRLGLFDAPIPASLLASVCGVDTVAALVRTPLAIVSQEGENVRIAPAGRAIRDALRARPPEEIARHRRVLLAELALRPGSDLAADHARLLLEDGRLGEAFDRLTRDEVAPRSVTARTLQILAHIIAASPLLLSTAATRTATARRLSTVPEAGPVTDALFAAMPATLAAEDLEAASLLAANDYAARRYDRVVALASRAEDLAVSGAAARFLAHLRVNHARAVLAKRPDAAAPLLRAAALTLRRLGRSERVRALELRAEYELASARFLLVRGQTGRAVARHRSALQGSRRAHSATLIAQTLTNLAVALQQNGQVAQAERVTSRAVRIKLALGDIAGAVGSLHNLARLRSLQGAALDAAALHTRAIALGTRTANHHGVTLSLLLLAEIYDSQRNPRLAVGALLRSAVTARAAGLHQHGIDATRGAAVLLSIMGHVPRAQALLRQSARHARTARASRARTGHFEARAMTSFLVGDPNLARHYLNFAGGPESTNALRICVGVQAALAGRPSDLPNHLKPAPAREMAAFRAAVARIVHLSRGGVADTASDVLHLTPNAQELGSRELSGTHQRLLTELLVGACHRARLPAERALSLLATITRVASEQGFRLTSSRAGALRCLILLRQNQLSAASRELSTALAELQGTGDAEGVHLAWVDALRSVPVEFRLVLATLRPSPATSRGFHLQQVSTWTELHAAAHALVLKSGAVHLPDTRLQTALRTILSISARLKTSEGLEALLESLTRFARDITRAERACIVLLRASGAREVHIATESLPVDSAGRRTGISHTVIQRVMASRTPLLLHDVYGDSELMERPSIASLSLRSIMCVPMMRGDQLYGAMYADSSAGAGSFDKVDLEILALLAEQAAAAVETSRLLVDVQRSYGELKSAQERLIRGERLRVMGEMTSGVAHEFNNLLTAILARIQLLSLEYLAPTVRDSLHLIEKAALDAASVVRRLQTFTRAQRQADYQVVDMGEVCADAVEFLRPLWATRRQSGRPGIVVRLRSSAGLTARGDATELREVVTNLLKNALEALEQGGNIVVTVERRSGKVRVEVADDGPGIPVELQQKLFTPFFTTKGDRGTGLGLCLSQQIIERHGGDLRLSSTPGTGTTAVFEVPEAQVSCTPPESSEVGAEGGVRPLSVIVVDDDPNVLGPLCAYLERSGFSVRGARSASECLAAANSVLPDVVISDIAMPGLDGLEMCRRLRRKYPQLPVVLMTGQTSDIDPQRARLSGASALLPKPFTMRQVLELLAGVAKSPKTR